MNRVAGVVPGRLECDRVGRVKVDRQCVPEDGPQGIRRRCLPRGKAVEAQPKGSGLRTIRRARSRPRERRAASRPTPGLAGLGLAASRLQGTTGPRWALSTCCVMGWDAHSTAAARERGHRRGRETRTTSPHRAVLAEVALLERRRCDPLRSPAAQDESAASETQPAANAEVPEIPEIPSGWFAGLPAGTAHLLPQPLPGPQPTDRLAAGRPDVGGGVRGAGGRPAASRLGPPPGRCLWLLILQQLRQPPGRANLPEERGRGRVSGAERKANRR